MFCWGGPVGPLIEGAELSETLSDDAIDDALLEIQGWSRDGNAITRTWECKGFNGAVQLVNVIAFVVNKLNHHPDVRLHDYKYVTVTSTTHVAEGITGHDLELARRINRVVDDE